MTSEQSLIKRQELVESGYTIVPGVMDTDLLDRLKTWSDRIFRTRDSSPQDPVSGQRYLRQHGTPMARGGRRQPRIGFPIRPVGGTVTYPRQFEMRVPRSNTRNPTNSGHLRTTSPDASLC